jgi:hypothetical protein
MGVKIHTMPTDSVERPGPSFDKGFNVQARFRRACPRHP